jgi:hypothetical protein
MGLFAPVSMILVILYSLEILEYADDMISFY